MNKKWLKVCIAVILVLGTGTGGYYTYKKYKQSNTVAASSNFNRARVVKTNLDATVQATGRITGAEEVNIYSSNSGVIQQMNFTDGSSIKKGDLFCKISNDTQQQDIQSAQNTLNQKNIELKNLENNLDSVYIKAPIDGKVKSVFVSSGDDVASVKPAYGGMAIITVGNNGELEVPIPFPQSGKISEVNISSGSVVKKGQTMFKLDDATIRNSIEAKRNEVNQAQNQLNFKQEAVSKSTIISPIDGVISNLNIKNGDVTPNEKAMATVTDNSKMEAVVPVDELDIDKVKVGQKVSVAVQDIKDEKYEGTVEKISQSGKTTNNVTTFDVTVSIDNPERLKIGMNADVSIAVESKQNVLAIPVEALIERNGKKYVMVSEDNQKNTKNKADVSTSSDGSNKGAQGQKRQSGAFPNGSSMPGKLTEVKIGLRNQTMVEILSGVSENQNILIQLPQSTSANKNQANQRANGMGSGMNSGISGGKGK